MTSSEPTQNLTLCVAIMAFSGFLRVIATMVLAFPDFLAKNRGSPLGGTAKQQKCYGVLFVCLHVLILTIAAGMSIVGSFYGPVSIAVPVQTGSQLLFNVAAMGIVLNMRAFDKAQRTGTYVVFFSVLSLMDVGPGLQDGQDVMVLLSETNALVWSTILSLAMVIAAIFTVPLLRKDSGASEPSFFERHSFLTLTIGVTVSNVGMATSGKTLGILTGTEFAIAAVYYVVASLLGLIFSIVSATSCDQGIFTPLSSVALIIVNMITGIIIWEDWKVIDTWLGYMCACMLMCCGVYLLAEVDVIEKFAKNKAAEIVGRPTYDQNAPDALAENAGGGEGNTWEATLETTKLTTTVPDGYS